MSAAPGMSLRKDKKKGPAEVATSPSHGSHNPLEGKMMNTSTDSAGTPRRQAAERPSLIGQMQGPLAESVDLSIAIMMIAAESSDQESGVICTMSGLLLERCRKLEGLRNDLWAQELAGRRAAS